MDALVELNGSVYASEPARAVLWVQFPNDLFSAPHGVKSLRSPAHKTERYSSSDWRPVIVEPRENVRSARWRAAWHWLMYFSSASTAHWIAEANASPFSGSTTTPHPSNSSASPVPATAVATTGRPEWQYQVGCSSNLRHEVDRRQAQQLVEALPRLKVMELDICEPLGLGFNHVAVRSLAADDEGEIGPMRQQSRRFNDDLDPRMASVSAQLRNSTIFSAVTPFSSNFWHIFGEMVLTLSNPDRTRRSNLRAIFCRCATAGEKSRGKHRLDLEILQMQPCSRPT